MIESLEAVAGVSRLLTNLYDTERIHAHVLNHLSLECVDVMLPQPGYTEVVNIEDDFKTLKHILSVIDHMQTTENSQEYYSNLADLEHIAGKAMCGMFNFNSHSKFHEPVLIHAKSLPAKFKVPEVADRCDIGSNLLLKYVRDKHLLHRIEGIAFTLRNKYRKLANVI
ncbi:hypothetical protein MAR_016356 [Mya arenaria]|uniref:Uncharacterized protein n=2 Tax=Mya arenaria TaxID=6604 RepID=A0ABY7FLC6_MYAAR|nr:uncharacterized protein LOC128212209 isoform X2 [Mya arenaria]WAR22382.1 hypothetical protein MAR_016356 [Mya arenaria]